MQLRIKILMLLLASFTSRIFSQEVVELKMPKSNKIVIKLMFRNGSVTDPKGKEGLTQLVTDLITSGGTKELTVEQITDKIYPWAAGYGGSTDKEVSVFTFQVPAVFLISFTLF
jgi:zinc protease